MNLYFFQREQAVNQHYHCDFSKLIRLEIRQLLGDGCCAPCNLRLATLHARSFGNALFCLFPELKIRNLFAEYLNRRRYSCLSYPIKYRNNFFTLMIKNVDVPDQRIKQTQAKNCTPRR